MGLPEIVATILEQLHDTKALFAALQVNRMWADEATTLLWRVDPPISAFARIEDPERLQYYADKISSLVLTYSKEERKGHPKSQYLLFPRLSEIVMTPSDPKGEQTLVRYLQSGLQKLTFTGGPISSHYLMRSQAQCPALRSISLHHLRNKITSNDLLGFLKKKPSLTKIRLGHFLQNLMSERLLIHLASRPNLVTLETSRTTLTFSLITTMQEAIAQPFPELLHLVCFSESKAFSQLSRHLNRLTKLHLNMVDAARDTVLDICSCTNLVKLDLNFEPDSHFGTNTHCPPESLLVLAKSCPHLQSFTMMYGGYKDLNSGDTPKITDEVIRDFVAFLPGLRCFRLYIKTSLTHHALRSLGEGCTNLKYCSLEGKSFPLWPLGSNGKVLFPQLERLGLIPVEEDPSVVEAAEMLHHHAPRVQEVDIGLRQSFGGELYERIQGLRRRDEARSLLSHPDIH